MKMKSSSDKCNYFFIWWTSGSFVNN